MSNQTEVTEYRTFFWRQLWAYGVSFSRGGGGGGGRGPQLLCNAVALNLGVFHFSAKLGEACAVKHFPDSFAPWRGPKVDANACIVCAARIEAGLKLGDVFQGKYL